MHKIIHKHAVVDSLVVAEVKKSYKNPKAPKLMRVILPGTTDHLYIQFNTTTDERRVWVPRLDVTVLIETKQKYTRESWPPQLK